MRPLLISEAYIKKYGTIEDNVDPKLISSTTIMVQDQQLQQILGTDLYNEICTQVIANTLSSLNRTLLVDYIQDFLACAIMAEGCMIFLYRFSNKGPVTSNSENDFPISQEQVSVIENKWYKRSDFYSRRLKEFLLAHLNDYPLFIDGNTALDKMRPRSKGVHTGWVIGPSRRHISNGRHRHNKFDRYDDEL